MTYTSVSASEIEISLTLERDVSNILKDLKQRLIEKETYKDEDGPIEKYIAKEEIYRWKETGLRVAPIQSENWIFWSEDVVKSSRLLLVPSKNLYPKHYILKVIAKKIYELARLGN